MYILLIKFKLKVICFFSKNDSITKIYFNHFKNNPNSNQILIVKGKKRQCAHTKKKNQANEIITCIYSYAKHIYNTRTPLKKKKKKEMMTISYGLVKRPLNIGND